MATKKTTAKANNQAEDENQNQVTLPENKDRSTLEAFIVSKVGAQASDEDQKKARETWETLNCDLMPEELAIAVFDCGMRDGVEIANRLLGKIGIINVADDLESSVEAALETKSAKDLATEYLSWCLRRCAFKPNASTFLREWAQDVLKTHGIIVNFSE